MSEPTKQPSWCLCGDLILLTRGFHRERCRHDDTQALHDKIAVLTSQSDTADKLIAELLDGWWRVFGGFHHGTYDVMRDRVEAFQKQRRGEQQ